MRAGTAAGGTDVADDLSGIDIVTLFDHIMGHVHISRGKSVAVVNGHIVTGTTGLIIRGGNNTAASGHNGITQEGVQIHTVVHLVLSGNGVDTHTVSAGHIGAAQQRRTPDHNVIIRVFFLGRLRRRFRRCFRRFRGRFRGCFRRLRRCLGRFRRSFRRLGRCLGGLGRRLGGFRRGRRCRSGRHRGCQPLPILGSVVLLLRLRNLLRKLLLQQFAVIHQVLKFDAHILQLVQQTFCLCPLFFQPGIGFLLILLDLLQPGFFLFQRILGIIHRLSSFSQFIQTAVIRCGNLLHHAEPVQQIGKAVSLEQHRPVAHPAIFFHGADPVFILLIQLLQPGLSLLQFHLRIRDQKAVGRDLILCVGDLLVEQEYLLVDILFLLHHFGQLSTVLAIPVFQILQHSVDGIAFLFQLVQLCLQFAGGRLCRNTCAAAKEQACRQKDQNRR